MSDLIVKIVRVSEVVKHPNADRLDLVRTGGFWCIAGLNQYSVNQLVIFIPPEDSVLTDKLCNIVWPEGSLIKIPSGNRIRTLKLRGAVSQGLLLNPTDSDLLEAYPKLAKAKEGDDVAEILGITKWEPPAAPAQLQGTQACENTKFDKYTNLQNIKHYNNLFKDGEQVVVSCKIHGSCHRSACLEKTKLNFFEKIKKFFGFKTFEFCVGSRNMNLKVLGKENDMGFGLGTGQDNVYTRVAKKYDLESKLSPGEILYGEVYGVQKNYSYGLKPGEVDYVAFDLKRDGQYVSHDQFEAFCKERGIPTVPVLYKGPFSMEKVLELTEGPSVLDPKTKVREGVVVKSLNEEQNPMIGRSILKSINPSYLLKEQSEFQ